MTTVTPDQYQQAMAHCRDQPHHHHMGDGEGGTNASGSAWLGLHGNTECRPSHTPGGCGPRMGVVLLQEEREIRCL